MRTFRRVSVALVAAALGVLAAGVPAAPASEQFSDVNVRVLSLGVNAKGEALVQYRREDGRIRRVLAWDAVDARVPTEGVPQVRFRWDYAGGWGKYRRLEVWKTFRNVCGPYAGPSLPLFVAGCTAPDGSHWALQSFQRLQPLLGFEPWLPRHTASELHLSHWTGDLAVLEVSTNWTYAGRWQGVFGRLTYARAAVHGFATTSVGNPKDRYGRNVYIDTLNSAYGPGWKRESGILLHRPTGTFCHSFVPQKPFPHYPSKAMRPAAPGERYRVTVMGPGVTPIVQWEGPGLTEADRPRDPELDALFDRIMAGDRICAHER
jgi:hypothetical protein